MFMLISNEPIKNRSPSKIGQSINGELRTCYRNGNSSFSKSKKSFGCLMKRGTFLSKKNEINIWAVKILFPLDFAIYLSYSEMQKNRKVDNFYTRFQQARNLF